MRVPDPKANTTTEAYLAYKAGYLEDSELKPKLYEPYLHFDAWLAYWAGLTNEYPLDKNGDPEMLTDEEALVAYLSGVTDTYPEEIKDPYDVRIVGYLKHLASIRWPEPDYPVNNEEFYLSTMEPTHTSNSEPSADIELDTVEGKIISVEAYGDTHQQTYSGKNLFNYQDLDNLAFGTLPGSTDVVILTSSSYRGYYHNVTPGQTYTLSRASTSVPNRFRIGFTATQPEPNVVVYDETGTTSGFINGDDYKSRSFTVPSNMNYVCLYLSNSSQDITESMQIQLELGGSATSYEPYDGGISSPSPSRPEDIQVVTGEQTITISDGTNSKDFTVNLGSTELAKIGTYQDYIYKSGDDWYLHKETEKKTLTGSDGWIQQAPTHTNVLNTYITMSGWGALQSRYKVWCNMVKYTDGIVGQSNDSYINVCSPNAQATNLLVDVSKAEFPTIRAWTTFLNTHNLLVYYVLATPTDTKITDSTLISQLEALAGADTYNEKTFIKVTANDPNLPALLKVEAYKY